MGGKCKIAPELRQIIYRHNDRVRFTNDTEIEERVLLAVCIWQAMIYFLPFHY